VSELSNIIADEIRRNGPITMARFMELALYCPVYGYYERDADRVGKQGDFLTSVSVGSVFGELLGACFARWLATLNASDGREVHIVEAGAHDGRLALDVISWLLQKCPEMIENLQYHLVEPSNTRREWQRQNLREFGSLIRWSPGWAELRRDTRGVRGVIFSNEILDALPVHRLGWDRGRQMWFEWLVNEEGGAFVWSRGGVPRESLLGCLDEMVPQSMLSVLPEGYVVEVCPAAVDWWDNAARSLEQGWLVTFDYGFDPGQEVRPERIQGTLRAYQHHQVSTDVLLNPGEQDITAHVHFGSVRSAGERIGLGTEFFGEQSRFLSQLLQQGSQADQSWPSGDAKRLRQLKTLIHPAHFGRSFKVLVQSKL
jgi:SAM-dependent MidA family methyltransferase